MGFFARLLVVLAGAHWASAQVITQATIDSATSIQLPPASMYIYGMATGGASPSTTFAAEPYAQAVNAAGFIADALAYGPNSQNSFATSTAFHVIGAISVSGSWNNFKAISGSNLSRGASSASVSFTVTENSLVVFIGLASSQQSISIGGISGLQVDALSSGPSASVGMEIAHANLTPGSYTVSEHSTARTPGQDPMRMADLIGAFVFGSGEKPLTISLGQTTDEVIRILGEPPEIIDLGEKRIYSYPDRKITFVDGKVADVGKSATKKK